ncbi:MAG: hypothetical protein IH987_09835 [Planctomycetes bacterium]|nr:hypothetical protein [Planctomycetota bacterium]
MCRRTVRSVVICTLLFVFVPALRGANFAWVPTGATGDHNIVGQEIILTGAGQEVTLDLEMSGWDPDQDNIPRLAAFQVTVDSSGYSSGMGTALNPLGWPDSPELGAFQILNRCTINFGQPPTGAPCTGQADCPEEACIADPNFVFTGLNPITAIATTSLDYELAAVAQIDGRTDDGINWYGATLVLEVPLGAVGTYTIGFVNNPNSTFMRDELAGPITPIILISAQITVLCAVDADCNDANACTIDSCLGDGTCQNTLNYDDALFCCNPADGSLTSLDDGNECTSTVCDIETGAVIPTCLPEGTFCGSPATDGCDAQDTCDGNCSCVDRKASSGTPCGDPTDTDCTDPDTCDGGGTCDPHHAPVDVICGDQADTDCTDPDTCCGNGACCDNHTLNGAPCDDGAFCTTDETCTAGTCAGGSDTCDDDVDCSDDSCDEQNDVCSNVPNDTNCNNGQFCDGVEICDAQLDCVVEPGTVPDCNDLVGCTLDSCDEVNDVCSNVPNNLLCDNGQFCDGPETCDPQNDCRPGIAPNCDDGIDCTDDSCDEVKDVCVNDPNNGLCPDDTLFCNGSEICVAGLGCDHTGSPCGGPCDEDEDICLCDAPIVVAAGSRYLAVSLQPAGSQIPQAIVVRGKCAGGVARYVGAPVPFFNESLGPQGPESQAGLLVDDPADAVFLTPADWGDPVYVTGLTLAPGSTYEIWADCGSPGNPGFSELTTALTYRFGDVDGNTVQNFVDVQLCLLAFVGDFLVTPDVTRSKTDMAGCEPNLRPNIVDAFWSILGFQGKAFVDVECSNECPPCHPADCDDDDVCTDDSCVIETGECLNVINFDEVNDCCDPETGDAHPIDDGDSCTIDSCDAATGVVTNEPIICQDANDCTVDECVNGTCVFTLFTDIECVNNADCPPTSPGCLAGRDCTCPGTAATLIEFVPVSSSGPFSIDGNEIFISQGGVDVTLEVFISAWEPRLIRVYQAQILGETSYTSGDAGFLIPLLTPDPEAGAFIDTSRPDFIFRDPFDEDDWLTGIGSLFGDPQMYAWAGVILLPNVGQADTGVRRYAGTLILEVSPDAAGSFTVEFNPSINFTFLADELSSVFPLIELTPGLITITGP